MKHDGLQAPVPDDWGRIHDIRWFSENLNSAQFRALSTGLGLGSLRAAGARGARLNPGTAVVSPAGQPAVFSSANYASPEIMIPQGLGASPQNPVSSPARTPKHGQPETSRTRTVRTSLPFVSRLSVWAFDFLVVVVSLAVAFAVAVVMSMVKTGETDNWLALRPVRFLSERSAVEILAAVYAIFAVYMVVFKLGAGRTFGEVIFRPKQEKNASSVTS